MIWDTSGSLYNPVPSKSRRVRYAVSLQEVDWVEGYGGGGGADDDDDDDNSNVDDEGGREVVGKKRQVA